MSKSNGQKREPLFHIVKRSTVPSWAAWLIRIGAVILALLVCAVVTVVITGQNPAEAYMEPAPESCNAPVRFARSHSRIQDEILEHRR